MLDPRRAFITGGQRFAARHLQVALEETLPRADFAFTKHTKTATLEASWGSIDLVDSKEVNAFIEDFRPILVVHFAGQSSVGGIEAAGATWSTNVGGAIAPTQAVARGSPSATVLNVSCSEVYGWSFLDGPVKEDTPLRPMNVYGRTKAAAEAVFSDVPPATAKSIAVRPFNHTGTGQDERFVVASLGAQIARNERGESEQPIRVGILEPERDFLDVLHAVRAYVGLIEHSNDLPMRSVFIVCSLRAVKISDLLTRLLAMAMKPIPLEQEPTPMRASEIPCAVGRFGNQVSDRRDAGNRIAQDATACCGKRWRKNRLQTDSCPVKKCKIDSGCRGQA